MKENNMKLAGLISLILIILGIVLFFSSARIKYTDSSCNTCYRSNVSGGYQDSEWYKQLQESNKKYQI